MYNSKKNVGQPQWYRIVLFLLLSFMILSLFLPYAPVRPLEISYTQLKQLIKNGKVTRVDFEGDKITAKADKPLTAELEIPGKDEEGPLHDSFKAVKPAVEDPDLLASLEKNDVTVYAESQEKSWWRAILVSFLPWILIIGLIVYSSRRFQGGMGPGGGGLFGFGKSKAKLYTKEMSDVGYKDVAGLGNTKKELQEIVFFLRDPDKFQSLGGELPRGVLLVGPPGTGKTLMAKATAGEAGVPFYSISGSEFIEMFVGVGASRVRDMFKKAKQDAPSIIFIDELDAIGRARGTGLGGGHDEREQTLNQILAEMDGFAPHHSVVVMSATNRPDVLDPALTRPGRFDRQVTLELPQKEAREEILEVHIRKVPVGEDVDLETLARKTVGFSGADLRNLVNEAALLAARKEKKAVEKEDFDEARDKILMGIEREESMNEEDREVVAYHESGHALVAMLLPGSDPIEKVSIIPRGRSMGATEQIPEEDRRNLTRSYLLDRITIMLAGRAAERISKDDVSTGAADDLKNASGIARRMVCQWGMSDKLGSVTFRQGEQHPFLGKEIAQPKDFSEKTAQIIDEEIRSLIQETENRARKILEQNRGKLDLLARELMERETLDKEEMEKVLNPPS